MSDQPLPGPMYEPPSIDNNLPGARRIVAEMLSVLESRRQVYGQSTTDHFTDVAAGWSVIFGVTVPADRVAMAMVWYKLCRELQSHQEDNILDAANYTVLIEEFHPGDWGETDGR